MSIPEILLSLILALVLPLLAQGCEPFGFLISAARRIGTFAVGENSGTSDQANQLKVLHMSKYITIRM